MKISKSQLAGMIDHTNLKASATREDFQKLCDEARSYGFKSVAINSYPVAMCAEMLKDSNVLPGAALSFPLGQTTIAVKVAEAKDAIENGAGEFDYVCNVGKVKEHDWGYITEEMQSMVSVAREAGIVCKVILETCYLTDDEIIGVCNVAREVKPDFVKTSTGFGTAGAKVEHVRLMKETVGDDVQVKAAGGIRDLDTALAMIEAGATRLGTSSGIKICDELAAREGE